MKRAVIYIRTVNQNGTNIQRQHHVCSDFCKTHHLEVVGTLAEVSNGYGLSNRPKLDDLRRMMQEGVVEVVVESLSRLSRNTDELIPFVQEAEIHHVDVVSVFELVPGEDITPLRAEAMTRERERAATVLALIDQQMQRPRGRVYVEADS
jgi:DNA invertase Pin-like site-specific DNA recombinase